MAKLIEIDGKFYRHRRGKLVQIPDEWVGKVTYPQTIQKRLSKKSPKEVKRRTGSYMGETGGTYNRPRGLLKHPNTHAPRLSATRPQPRDDDWDDDWGEECD